MTNAVRDWRGTLIEPGRTVVYGGPVGRSIQQVEGVVEGFTKSGRVNVRVVRRSFTSGDRDVVHVGADRLTVVDALPHTDVPTQAEASATKNERWRVYQTHDIPPFYNVTGPPWVNEHRVCARCGAAPAEGYERECST